MADDVPAPLPVARLEELVAAGEVDTVLVVLHRHAGPAAGQAAARRVLPDDVLEHGTEGCNYLLAVDVDMNTVDGYAMSSWERGYGDFVLRPDLATLRRGALAARRPCWCSATCSGSTAQPVRQSPRQILARQVEAAAERGCVALAGTELEFIVFEDTYEQAWDRGYRGLTPANQYNVDYSMLGTGAGRAAAARTSATR